MQPQSSENATGATQKSKRTVGGRTARVKVLPVARRADSHRIIEDTSSAAGALGRRPSYKTRRDACEKRAIKGKASQCAERCRFREVTSRREHSSAATGGASATPEDDTVRHLSHVSKVSLDADLFRFYL